MGNLDLIIIITSAMGRWPCIILGTDYDDRIDAIKQALEKYHLYELEYTRKCEKPYECDFEITDIMICEKFGIE